MIIKSIKDQFIDQVISMEIKYIIEICFPDSKLFPPQMYSRDIPLHRLYIEDNNKIIAHLSIYKKTFNNESSFIGIGEVCVLPEYRHKGLAKLLLYEVEKYHSDINYFILLGKLEIYNSSGYERVDNVYFEKDINNSNPNVMIKCINKQSWPKYKIVINGDTF